MLKLYCQMLPYLLLEVYRHTHTHTTVRSLQPPMDNKVIQCYATVYTPAMAYGGLTGWLEWSGGEDFKAYNTKQG